MWTRNRFLPVALTLLVACGDKETQESDECYTDDDCAAGLVCVISHDHPGDDHDHGGRCEVEDSGSR